MSVLLGNHLKNTKYERWRWTMFALTWLTYATYYLTRKSFAIAKVAFADDPDVTMTREQYGIVDSSYLIAYMLGQFMWGPLGDRLGPRRILIVGMILGIGAAICSGFSTGLIAFSIFAVVQGLGQSTGWSNLVKTMSSWFSLRERGRVMGWWCTHYAVGAAVALTFAGLMMNYFGTPRADSVIESMKESEAVVVGVPDPRLNEDGVYVDGVETIVLIKSKTDPIEINVVRKQDGKWASSFTLDDAGDVLSVNDVGSETHFEAVQREAAKIQRNLENQMEQADSSIDLAEAKIQYKAFNKAWEGWLVVDYWPAGFWAPAGVLGIVLVLVLIFHRDRPRDVGLPKIEDYHGEAESVIQAGTKTSEAAEGSWAVVAQVLKVRGVWLLAASYFAIKLTRYALYFWGPKYISESLGSGALSSGMTAAWLPLGGAFGVLISGYLSDKVFQSRRMPITVLFLLATMGIMLLGLLRIENMWLMSAFFFFIGFFMFGPDSIISGTAAMDFGTKKGAATAAGVINGVGSIGAILGGYLPGVITTEENWAPLFWVFIGGLLFSAAILTPMWNKKPPTIEEKTVSA